MFYLVDSSGTSSMQYFMTVSEAMQRRVELLGKDIRVSGAVIGESIMFDATTDTLSFLIANVPADYEEVDQQGGLAVLLANAVADPDRQRLEVVYSGEKPDLLRNMAQAIITGALHADGRFYADELWLRCPSRYEEAVPDQAVDR